MVEGERSSIIGEIEEQRRLKTVHEASVEEAEKAIPAFRDRLGVLIRTHIVPPQEKLIDFWETHGHFGRERNAKSYPTTLNARINTSQGIIEVNIAATSYPPQETNGSGHPSQVDYKVDVRDLDHYLLIEGGKGFLESKDRESSMPRENPVIGKKYDTWPAWKRPVGMHELKRYSELLDTLGAGDVGFSGSTPDVIKVKPGSIRTGRTVNAP